MPMRERTDREMDRRKAGNLNRVMLVGISGTDAANGEPYGEIVYRELSRPVPYQGLAELGFRMDEIAQLFNLFPESPGSRSPGSAFDEGNGSLPEEYKKRTPAPRQSRESFPQSFTQKPVWEAVWVEVLGRRYGSLQGRLRCRGWEGADVYFRSALELMHLFTELLRDARKERSAEGTLRINRG